MCLGGLFKKKNPGTLGILNLSFANCLIFVEHIVHLIIRILK